MTEYARIYSSQAEQYDALVMREDYQHNLLRTIQQITVLNDVSVVESGAGPGV